MSRPHGLPFSIPLLILDMLGALLMAAALVSHFGDLQLLPAPLLPWALPLAGIGFALTIPFALDMVRRAKARQRAGAGQPQDSAVRRG